MEPNKGHGLRLLSLFLLVTAYHFLPALHQHYTFQSTVRMLQVTFNEMLLRGNASHERMRNLKLLINNYSSLQAMDIFGASDEDLQRAVSGLRIVHAPLWCVYTPKFQVSILGPVVFPLLLHIARNLLQ